MKTFFTLEENISELVLENKSIKEISSILHLDSNYIIYMLTKIRNNVIKSSDDSKFLLGYKIDYLNKKAYGRSVLFDSNNKSKQLIIDLIIKGKSITEIMNEFNISFMNYVSVLRYIYYELSVYGNDYEKRYLPLFKKRINEIDKYGVSENINHSIITSSNEKLIVESKNGLVALDGRFHQVYELTKENFKYIVIADTHFGSVFENFDYIKMVYEYAVNNNIKYIFHAGDLIEGEFAEFGRCPYKYKNIMAQIEHVINEYSYDKEICNYILFGNHDLHALLNGIDITRELSVRDDFKLLGFRSAYLHIKNEYIALKHEISRIKNDIVDEQVLLSFHGHPHHYRCIYNNRNTIFKSPTLSDMKSNNLAYVNRGFFVGSVCYDNNEIGEIEVEYINFDDRSKNFIYRKTRQE